MIILRREIHRAPAIVGGWGGSPSCRLLPSRFPRPSLLLGGAPCPRPRSHVCLWVSVTFETWLWDVSYHTYWYILNILPTGNLVAVPSGSVVARLMLQYCQCSSTGSTYWTRAQPYDGSLKFSNQLTERKGKNKKNQSPWPWWFDYATCLKLHGFSSTAFLVCYSDSQDHKNIVQLVQLVPVCMCSRMPIGNSMQTKKCTGNKSSINSAEVNRMDFSVLISYEWLCKQAWIEKVGIEKGPFQ